MNKTEVFQMLHRETSDTSSLRGLSFQNVTLLGVSGNCGIQLDSSQHVRAFGFHIRFANDSIWDIFCQNAALAYGTPSSSMAHPQFFELQWKLNTIKYVARYIPGHTIDFYSAPNLPITDTAILPFAPVTPPPPPH